MTLQARYSTIDAAAVAQAVEADYDVGPIEFACLVNRGFNDVYELRGVDGRRRIARLSGRRFRGPANLAYETAFLAHLKGAGLPVATAIAGRDGRLWRSLRAPEGPRTLVLFDHRDGDPAMRSLVLTGKLEQSTLDDLGLLGAGLARIHAIGESYSGPPSRYRLDSEHLLRQPLAQVLAAPTLDDSASAGFVEIGETLATCLAEVSARLSQAACHGDVHGGNTLVRDGAGAGRVATWIDFDDGGPGFLAYDLAVFLWSMLRHMRSATPNDFTLAMWTAFIEGYRSIRPILQADFESVGLFVSIRHIWYLGEYASRTPEWGMQTISRDWLHGELALLRTWDRLTTPPV